MFNAYIIAIIIGTVPKSAGIKIHDARIRIGKIIPDDNELPCRRSDDRIDQ
jgi:hypothetical protein